MQTCWATFYGQFNSNRKRFLDLKKKRRKIKELLLLVLKFIIKEGILNVSLGQGSRTEKLFCHFGILFFQI